MSSSAVQLTQYEAVPMPQACANCEEVITGTPYEADGEVFCCVACSGGGPCQCTYTTDGATALQPAVAIAETAPAYQPVPEPLAPVAITTPLRPMPIEPAPLAWPAPEQITPVIRSRPQILRVSGLDNQLDVLRLGSVLEAEPEISDVALVRADLDDVWFAVTVADADYLAAALMRVASFDVDARPHPAGVDASVRAHVDDADLPPVQPEVASIPATAHKRREEPDARPRFRLFRRSAEATPPLQPSLRIPSLSSPMSRLGSRSLPSCPLSPSPQSLRRSPSRSTSQRVTRCSVLRPRPQWSRSRPPQWPPSASPRSSPRPASRAARS